MKPSSSLGICLIVCAAIALPTTVQAHDNTVELSWRAVPEFWDEVEAALDDGPVFDGQYPAPKNSEQHQKENRQWLAKLQSVPFPQLKGLPRVIVFPDQQNRKEFIRGSLIKETDEAWHIFSNRWQVVRIAKTKHSRIERGDVAEELTAIRDYGNALMEKKPGQPSPVVPFRLHSFHYAELPLNGGSDFVVSAYLAHVEGRTDDARRLIRIGFFYTGRILKETYDELAWRLFEPAVLSLYDGASRDDVAKQFLRIAEESPDGTYHEQAQEYADTLRRMAIEDSTFKLPKSFSELSIREQVEIDIFRLRDCRATQFLDPGSCSVSPWDFSRGADLNAADRLALRGFDAVPALLKALDDTRLTRCYGFPRHYAPSRYVLQVRDAAIETLNVISSRRLYASNNTNGYLSNETDELRLAAIERARAWWADAQKQDEAAWIRERLNAQGNKNSMYFGEGQRLIRRLAAIAGAAAIPDINAWAKAYPHRTELAYELRFQVKDPTVAAELRGRIHPDPSTFELAALQVLHSEKEITDAQYNDLLFDGCSAIVKANPTKLDLLHSRALLETGEERSAVVVGESLRAGWRPIIKTRWIRNPEIGWKIAPYLLPYFDDIMKTDRWSQYYENQPDIYRTKDDAALVLNAVVGRPIREFYYDTPPERDAAIAKLKSICDAKGIRPAFTREENRP